jgi:hypothetical protein
MLHMVMPLNAPVVRDRKNNELVDRPRQHAFEFKVEAEVLDAAREPG